MVKKEVTVAAMLRDKYISHSFYKVFYTNKTGEMKEAFFEDREDAAEFAKRMNGVLNAWSWEGWIEK